MDTSPKTENQSAINTYNADVHLFVNIINEDQRHIFQIVNYVFLCSIICVFGVITNMINLVVFYKQGLDSSINITFFSLAISDMCGLLFQILFNVFLNPLIDWTDTAIAATEFQFLWIGVPRETFAKITCLITVYATLERCLCIAFPLHIKQMITPRRTAVVMVAKYGMIFISMAPIYCATSIGWKFYPDRNRTLLGLISASNSDKLQQIVFILQAFIGLVSFVSVVIFTIILIRKLGQKSTWLQTANMDQAKSESMSNRDRKTISMVTLIASILIVCYTPGFILCLVTFYEPEFSVAGRHANLFFALWSFGLLFETLNSSVNIFLYHKMSTKYRDTFRSVFCNVDRNKNNH